MATTDQKNLRKLVEAVGLWLQFERLCRRQELFSESYLCYPAGQFLQARYASQLRTEFEHPVLAPLRTGRGDKPRVDFAVMGGEGTPTIAVETKWLNSSSDLTVQTIRDLVRLELLAHEYGTQCLFLLAGTRRDLRSFVTQKHFLAHPEHANSRTLLPHEGRRESASLWLDTRTQYRHSLLKKSLERFKGIEIARAIVLHRIGPYPAEGVLNSYMA